MSDHRSPTWGNTQFPNKAPLAVRWMLQERARQYIPYQAPRRVNKKAIKLADAARKEKESKSEQ